MQGDFSRDSFDALRGFTRVLCQQGRLALDADWNEMQAIQLHLLRTLAKDLIGHHGGRGFTVSSVSNDGNFTISPGHYYVDGFLCENDSDAVSYAGTGKVVPQPYWPWEAEDELRKGDYLVYLDVWEQHLAWPQTDGKPELDRRTPPTLREPALEGLDTASRARVVWQVRLINGEDLKDIVSGANPAMPDAKSEEFRRWIADQWSELFVSWLQPPARGRLSAMTDAPTSAAPLSPCAVAPEARYRGAENQLYRVEIHRGGWVGDATFKWSRENGSALLPVAKISGSELQLAAWWRDDRFGLTEGDWVEVFDDHDSLRRRARPLCRVKATDRDTLTVVLDEPPELTTAHAARHPVLRRWDQRLDGKAKSEGVPIDEETTTGHVLEAGIRLKFKTPGQGGQPNRYRTGDYWLIPARASLMDIVWPRTDNGKPEALAPHGVLHHYAPLAAIYLDGQVQDLTFQLPVRALT